MCVYTYTYSYGNIDSRYTPNGRNGSMVCICVYRIIPGDRNHRNDPASVFLSKYF